MRTSIYVTIIVALVYVLTGCSHQEEPKAVAKMPAIAVSAEVISGANSENIFTASGNVQPVKEANISTRMMGYVEKVNAKVGDRVSKGQLLVSISNTDLQAKLAQVKANILKAEAGVKNAKKNYDRLTTLKESNSVTQKDVDDITAHYTMAKAGLEAARQMEAEVNSQFQYTSITAPFSGLITAKFVNAGDMANPGMPLLTLATNSTFEVVAFVPENKISEVKKGAEVSVFIKSVGATIPATVSEIAVSSQHTGGQYIVKSKLGKHDHNLYAGMFTTVTFDGVASEGDRSIFIPASSMVTKGSLKGVYTVSDDNQAMLRWLRVGNLHDGKYEVFSGLKAGERIITKSDSKLYNGAPVSL